MATFNKITSKIVPLFVDNVDTDQIIPARFLKVTDKNGLGDQLFCDWRYNPDGSPKTDFILIPDQIRDPGNLGTLLRTAAAAGVQAVFIPPETTDPFAPKVVRAGMGAHFRLPILSMTWDQLSVRVQGMSVFLSDAVSEKSCWEVDFTHPTALVIGGEADGASAQAHSLATEMICIPMPGHMESLNAGAAGAVLMYEVVRQRSR